MRTINALILIFVLSLSCEKDAPDLIENSTDGFCIKVGDSVVLSHNQIDFYDISSHLIYLKDGYTFKNQNWGTFTVCADDIEVYSGKMYPMYSSSMPVGPVIRTQPSFYADYIIAIGFIKMTDALGNSNEDPRSDIRIIEALKKYNQYHQGLNCEIKSVYHLTGNQVKVELELSNKDSFNLYYLDPAKMGINLFHYFTNGLYLRNSQNKTFKHKILTAQPEPWDSWKKEWLSIINSKESKSISITYDNYETITPGTYHASFDFPGLTRQVEKKDLHQDNGRIWLGEFQSTKEITIE